MKLEEGDIYKHDAKRLILYRKNGSIEVYQYTVCIIPDGITLAEKESYMDLADIHPHLTRRVRCSSLLP